MVYDNFNEENKRKFASDVLYSFLFKFVYRGFLELYVRFLKSQQKKKIQRAIARYLE